ncbi:MAG: CRISPR-associated ring nuclease Csm6 [Verrucomicrobiia bacterium]
MKKKKQTKLAAQKVELVKNKTFQDNREVVLLAVTGMSPAVLTETIWALAHPVPDPDDSPIIPHRVVVITTSRGREEIIKALFTKSPLFGDKTVWESLREQLAKEGFDVKDRLLFGTTGDDIRVFTKPEPRNNQNYELDDIRTPEDNEAAADFILESLRAFVEDPDKIVIGSIAGGRKTMSALLYACFCLIGRDCDRLTHVLVNEPFEQLRDFFFPSQPGAVITHRDGGKFNPADAKIQLAEIPFVPLRYLFQRELGRPAGGFMRLVDTCTSNIKKQIGERIRLTVNSREREIEINGTIIKPTAKEHCLMLFLSNRAKEGEPNFPSYKEAIDPLNQYREQLIETAPKNNPADWRFSQSLKNKYDEDDLRKHIYSLKEKARRIGGEAASLAMVLPEKGRFGLEIPGSMIFIK